MKNYIYDRHLEEGTVALLQFPDNAEVPLYFQKIESVDQEIERFKSSYGFVFEEDMSRAPSGCVRCVFGWQ
jgi:hypothetical protein